MVMNSTAAMPKNGAFGTVCIAGWLFINRFVPETKGRSLREVTASFDSLSTSPLQ